jgi:hypothetical protein
MLTSIVFIAINACQHPAAPSSTGTTALTTPMPVSDGPRWPNEPAGLRLVADWGLDAPPPATTSDVPIPGSLGWKVSSGGAVNSVRGWVQLGSDPGAPLSPRGVYDFVYPEGMVEGNAPATVYYGDLGTRAIYVACGAVTPAPENARPITTGSIMFA